jgi:prepilin-type N-terminal cleavage/methylation domain-containing protein
VLTSLRRDRLIFPIKRSAGFTLVELLIVIAILGILAMIAVPAYIGQQKKAARSEAYSNLESLRLLEEQFYAENSVYAPSTGVAGADQPGNIALIQALGVLPGFKPGAGTGLSFSYQILQNNQLNTPVTNPPVWAASPAGTQCFTAVATGNTGRSRVTGDVFAIDCNNNKNF